MKTAKDLSKEPPRSPRTRIGGYALLARMADKGRAALNGTPGEYHFNCPLDQMLFSFKGVNAEQVKPVLASGTAMRKLPNGSIRTAPRKRRMKSRRGPNRSRPRALTTTRRSASGLQANAPAWD